jgi:endonuclease G, mitochondrial
MKLLTFILLFWVSGVANAEEKQVDYQGFSLWLDCDKRAATRFEYSLGKDTGDEKRTKYNYRLDPSLGDCQQLSTKSYWKESGKTHQRGHLVAFNHLDYSEESALDSNQMANILPQHKTMNMGAWKVTEEITECFREFGSLRVIGGATWNEDLRILETHGVDIPDYFWKVIFREDDSIAWIMPNDDTATRKALDMFIVSLQEIEKATGYEFSDNFGKSAKAAASWGLDACDGIPKWRS